MFKVIERFISIDGEGPTAGELATFIRFSDCNLRCRWCDTCYSWDGSSQYELMSVEEIYHEIQANAVKNVTLTGGEPLIQPGIEQLLQKLAEDDNIVVHIETNGSIAIAPFKQQIASDNIKYILDYKGPDSLMNSHMCLENLEYLSSDDVIKFVIASEKDLQTAYRILTDYHLVDRCLVYFSPVTEEIEASQVVEFMKQHELNGVKLQLQLHKYIWPKEMRGV